MTVPAKAGFLRLKSSGTELARTEDGLYLTFEIMARSFCDQLEIEIKPGRLYHLSVAIVEAPEEHT